MVTRIDDGLPYNGWRSRGCSGQLIGGTARLTGKMTCGGSGPGAVRLTKRAATVARRCHRKKSLNLPGDNSVYRTVCWMLRWPR